MARSQGVKPDFWIHLEKVTLKPESQNLKSERNPKGEIRMLHLEAGNLFGPRISDFFRISALGFRILLAPLLITAAHAQTSLSNLVFAVGTTLRDKAKSRQ